MIEMYTRRFATGNPKYPHPVICPILWKKEGSDLVARFELPPMRQNHLIVPSLSATGASGDWSATWHFRNGDRRWRLDTVPTPIAEHPTSPQQVDTSKEKVGYVQTQIDCFRTLHPIEVSFLELRMHDEGPPEKALIVIASGPYSRPSTDAGTRDAAACEVPPRSQMHSEPAIRRHICSPTCLSMVMGLGDSEAQEFVKECFDPLRKMYGIWPRNIRAANARGYTGAIETFGSLDEAALLISEGYPIITSIRFAEGELSGAPLRSTGGHLVVLRGLTKDKVLVNDPAADTHGEVAREYDREEFARAWLGARGVGYVLTRDA